MKNSLSLSMTFGSLEINPCSKFLKSSRQTYGDSFEQSDRVSYRWNNGCWKILPREMSAMLRLVAVSFRWRSGCRMGSFCRINIFIKFERKMNEKLVIVPKWGWMSKLRVIFRTKFKELLGDGGIRRSCIWQCIQTENIYIGHKHLFEFDACWCDEEVFYQLEDIES